MDLWASQYLLSVRFGHPEQEHGFFGFLGIVPPKRKPGCYSWTSANSILLMSSRPWMGCHSFSLLCKVLVETLRATAASITELKRGLLLFPYVTTTGLPRLIIHS